MTVKRNVEGLRQNALKKRQEALDKVEQGIRQLLKEGKPVNFNTVAQAADVSKAFLYKEPEIKERIEQLRRQGGKKKPEIKQRASDASKDAMIKTLKERIRKQEAEIRGLRDHIEVIQGIAMQVKDLNKQIGVLASENSKLKEQLDKCLASKDCVQSVKPDSKVTPLSKRGSTHPPTISDQVQSELDELGIRVNSTLAKLSAAAPKEMVLKAIDALREALANYEVHNPSGFLVEAIRNTWTPNEGYEQKLERDCFKEWYPIAKSLGLIRAATQFDSVQHVLTVGGEWVPFDVMVSNYPLEKLRKMGQTSFR